jgi:exosome complex RNA-binding protein Csl4
LEFEAGDGTYVKCSKIFSSLNGLVRIKKSDLSDKLSILVISTDVERSNDYLKIGTVVIGKITKIKEEVAFVKILSNYTRPSY